MEIQCENKQTEGQYLLLQLPMIQQLWELSDF